MQQIEYFGFNSIKGIKTILEEGNQENIFLVTGKNSYKSSGAEQLLNRLLANYIVTRFYGFSENPKIGDVIEGIKLFRKIDHDLIIAVGGGSVIDIAKLINTLSFQPENPVKYIKGNKSIENLGKPLIAIPTTSGSGAEATHFAVVYINKTKYSLAHKYILPDVSIVDPQFTMNLPKYITASTGMDALSQAIESYWSKKSTDESKKYSREAIPPIMDNLKDAVNNPSEFSRETMSKAAHLAGKAINIAKTTAPHAISYPFTSYFGIPHGHAVALTLGKFLVYNSQENDFSELYNLLGVKDVESAKDKLDNLMQDIGLETNFKKLGINNLDLIINNVNLERLTNNPRAITSNRLKQLLK